MTSISVCLVGKESLLKEGIKGLLAKKDFYIAGDYDDLTGVRPRDMEISSIKLVICVDEDGNGLPKRISGLKNIYSQNYIAIVSGHTETALARLAFDAGATAFISKDISCDDLVRSIKLAADGKKIYPASMFSLPAANANRAGHIGNVNTYNLSKQELKIVSYLANGEPNKVIARQLSITDEAVKVHVRTILRKFGTPNRTKAAILALSQGLAAAYEPVRVLAG